MVLNPALYASLRALNKHRDPRVSNAGVPAHFTVTTALGRPQIHGEGEQYAIDCPACSDTRCRLYVHHCFGQTRHILGYNQPGDQLLALAYCQNENKRIKLTGYLEGYVQSAKDSAQATLGFLNSGGTQEAPLKRVCPPMGVVVPIHEADPKNPAVEYLLSRRYNIEYLGRAAGAVLMIEHPDGDIARMTRGRIGFPFYVDGELRTWQARLPYDPKKTDRWPPKWWFPGQTDKVPWNTDVASQFKVVVLCEGITSAINMGPAAVGIGGKTLTGKSMEIVAKKWKRALVAIDPEAGINRKPGEIDYHTRLIEQLTAAGVEASGVRWTPGDNRDPGDLTPQENIELIRRSDPLVAAALPYVGL